VGWQILTLCLTAKLFPLFLEEQPLLNHCHCGVTAQMNLFNGEVSWLYFDAMKTF